MTHKIPINYVGSKANLAPEIVRLMSDHTCYVEPFGGSAAVLFHKPESRVEVYNDLHNHLCNFFRQMRDNPEQLQDYLYKMEYSRHLLEGLMEAWYHEHDIPSDDVVRAAEYFYLRVAGINAVHTYGTGFSAGKDANQARKFRNLTDQLPDFADRFQEVIIECDDYWDIINRYDGEDTFFYFDPPYIEGYRYSYAEGHNFNHEEFIEVLDGTEANWICSYDKLPTIPYDVNIIEHDQFPSVGTVAKGKAYTESEKLIMNYDPDRVKRFSASEPADEVKW